MEGISRSVGTSNLHVNYLYNPQSFTLVIPAHAILQNLGELSGIVRSIFLKTTAYPLKRHINYRFEILTAISGVDTLSASDRFIVAYDVLSTTLTQRFRMKSGVNETTPLDSLCDIYECANWWEREVWDLFGIFFRKHPDLRRILTDYGFEGHALRKDFPLSGYTESGYDTFKARVGLESLQLSQALRNQYYTH